MAVKEKLIPPDRQRCQAEITPAHSFMTLGPRPPPERCKAAPVVIVKEPPRADGREQGSMSLCADCLIVCKKQMPSIIVLPLGSKP